MKFWTFLYEMWETLYIKFGTFLYEVWDTLYMKFGTLYNSCPKFTISVTR